jgi:hypothetical protein
MLSILQHIFLSVTLLSQVIEGVPYRRLNGAATGKAIYILTNDAQNAVVALPIAYDGTLSEGTVISTGGAGSNAISGATNATAAPDALLSQSSLTVVGKVNLHISRNESNAY